MDKIVYALCGLTSGVCALLLLRGYLRSRMMLLFWSTICFFCLTLTNILVYVDFIIYPEGDLLALRNGITFIGLNLLIYGMIKETV